MDFSKKKIVFYLIIIGSISLAFKLYTADFSHPTYADDLNFTIRAIAHSHGDFSATPKQNPGWPLFISPFFLLIDSDSFLDYSNIVRVLSLGITTFTIFPMYLLGRKFFDEKYSLVVASLFAFEPHINRWSSLGLSEPLYTLVMVASFYFVLNKSNSKYVYLSFLLAGVLWLVRTNGIIMIIVISIIYFINFRGSTNLIKKYGACIAIFIIIISPILIQKYEQYGDPFYSYYENIFFVEDYSMLESENFKTIDSTAFNYIEKNGLFSFINRFIITGIENIFEQMFRILFPYLIILIPFGIIFSLRAFDHDKKYVRANWILMLITLGSIVIPSALISDRRFLFYIFPFLIIFSTLPIHRVTEYGLSTFSFSQRKKDIFLCIVIIIIIILSGLFTYNYGRPDVNITQEKIEFARFLIHNLNGRILDAGYTMEYVNYAKLEEPPGVFKTYTIDRSKNHLAGFPYSTGNVTAINVYGASLSDLISNGEQFGLKYISINQEGAVWHTFLNDVYNNEEKYPYLIKVFDSNEKFEKFKVKVFEINYEKFH